MPRIPYFKKDGAYIQQPAGTGKVKVDGHYISTVGTKVKAGGVYVTTGETPTNTVAPTIAGDAALGATLTVTPGTWTGVPTPTISHQWQAGGVDVPGEVALTYVTRDADAGKAVVCVERATNAAGSITLSSNAILMPDTGFSSGFDTGFH